MPRRKHGFFLENIPEFLEQRSEFGRKPEFYADLSFGSSVKKACTTNKEYLFRRQCAFSNLAHFLGKKGERERERDKNAHGGKRGKTPSWCPLLKSS